MNKSYKNAAYQRGLRAEKISKYWLRLKGYRILAERFRVPAGEIDLIAMKGVTIVAIEVKARPSLQQSLECITIQQRRRIERAFLWYINRHQQYAKFSMRLDVILVAPWCIKHIQNAWQTDN